MEAAPSATQPGPPGRRRLRHDLCASTTDNAAFAAHVGLGETYIPAFLLAAGGGQVASGLVATVPQLAGAALQLWGPRGVRLAGSLKNWVVLSAAAQSLSFVPLIVAAFVGGIPTPALFLIAAFYWAAGMAGGPAWNLWMSLLIPARIRARYFARRTRIGHVLLLSALLGGGYLLDAGKAGGREVQAFALVFLAAAIARSISTWYLTRQSHPRREPRVFRGVGPVSLLKRVRGGQDARLLIYMLAVTVSVQMSAGYFNPYMLETLQLSYLQYVSLTAAAYLARILSLPMWGRFAHRFGASRLLVIGGLGIMPMAGLWALASAYPALLVFQLLTGLTWSAYELATLLLTFETIREEERTSVLTLYNLANAIAIAGGSLAGAAIVATLTPSAETYHTLFLVSTAGRAVTLLLLFQLTGARLRSLPVAIRMLTVRPDPQTTSPPGPPGAPIRHPARPPAQPPSGPRT